MYDRKHWFHDVITHVLYRNTFETGLELDDEETDVFLEAGIKSIEFKQYMRHTEETHIANAAIQPCNILSLRSCIVSKKVG